MRRNETIELRCTAEEKESWRELARPYSLSEYIRQLLMKEENARAAEAGWVVDSSPSS